MLGVELAHPRDVFPALKAIRGHNMAKAAVEMAAWDLYARQRREPLWRTLGGVRDRIATGVSVGIQPSLADLADAYHESIPRRMSKSAASVEVAFTAATPA